MTRNRRTLGALQRAMWQAVIALACSAPFATAQDRGAPLIDAGIRGLTVSARVLVIGAHPADEDARLIAFLARGRQVETAYLSLTRGENGGNAIGNEVGEGLGAIRSAEAVAARKIDGGRQFFTRAFDFGYSRSASEALDHWPLEILLGDVVTVIRSFRPHVIVALYTGTPADSDGHHEASALLAREAFDAAADTARFPIADHGYPWTPLKLYGPGSGLTIDVGGFDPVLGMTYVDIATASRSLHRTQGVTIPAPDSSAAQRAVTLSLVASRASADGQNVASDTALFDGIDTTFTRLAAGAPENVRQAIALITASTDSARRAIDFRRPELVVNHLAHIARQATIARGATPRCLHPSPDASGVISARALCSTDRLDLDASIDIVRRRAITTLFAAAGVSIEATAERELLAYGDSMRVVLSIANHGADSVEVWGASVNGVGDLRIPRRMLHRDEVATWTRSVRRIAGGESWWLGRREQDLYPEKQATLDGVQRTGLSGLVGVPAVAVPEDLRRTSDVSVLLRVGGEVLSASAGPILFQSADPLLGVQDRRVSGVPPITLEFDHSLEWLPTGKPLDRLLRLTMRSFADSARTFSFRSVVPPGLRIDSLPESVVLQPHERRDALLRIRGTLPEGRFEFGLVGRYPAGGEFSDGFRTTQYPHLLPIRNARTSGLWLRSVKISVPAKLNVAYIQGVGDVITPYLRQLGVSLTTLGADELLNADLTQYTTVVIGPRAYEARPELIAYNGRLLQFVRRGGTLVVQHGTELTYSLGVFPYPLGLSPGGTGARVTMEDAPVRVIDPRSRLLAWPNTITETDWSGWAQERAVTMPVVIDPRYATPVEVHDPDQPENRGAILVASYGKGTYIFTTLAFSRQFPAAVGGAARLFVNLMSAGLRPSSASRP